MYRTYEASDDDLSQWDRMILNCPYSEAIHTFEWRKALSSSFRQLKPMYLVIKDGNSNIAGVLPSFVFCPIPLSRTLLSMPWALPGGLLIFPDADIREATLSVCDKLDEISRKYSLSEIVFTLPADYDKNISGKLLSAGYTKGDNRFTHLLNIESGYKRVWEAYNKRVRGAVRKAIKTGVVVRETEDGADMMSFYKLYLALMNRFGSTPKPFSLLRYLQTSPIGRFVIAELNGQVIGGLLFLHFNSCVRLWCEASDQEFLSHRPNNAMIDYIIRWSCERGYGFVDFGASPPGNDGLVAFKEEWKARKAWFCAFSKLYSPWRKKLWTISEPSIRRIYAAIQRFRL